MAAVLKVLESGKERATGDDGGAGPGGKVAAERSEFLLQCNAIRIRQRLSWKQWALDHAGCSPQEWSRFWNLDRRLSPRVVNRLLVLHPELRKAWLRSLDAEARRQRALDPGG